MANQTEAVTGERVVIRNHEGMFWKSEQGWQHKLQDATLHEENEDIVIVAKYGGCEILYVDVTFSIYPNGTN